MAKIAFNGMEYNRPEDMPADVRAQYEKAVRMLPDRDQNGIPDLLESANSSESVSPAWAADGRAPVSVPVAQIKGMLNKTARWLPVIVIAFIGGVLVCIALAFFGIMSLMKTSGVYQLAVETARANPTVQEILGAPLNEGLIVTGSTSENGSSGSASLQIPLSGDRQSGTLYVQADKENNVWKLTGLTLEAGGRQYSLLP